MSVETDLYDTLTEDASIAGVVGTKVYPEFVPQQIDMPAITYYISGVMPQYALAGVEDLKNTHMAIDVWCATYSQLRTLTEYVKAAMDGESTLFTAVLLEQIDIYEEGTLTHRTSLDYSIWHY